MFTRVSHNPSWWQTAADVTQPTTTHSVPSTRHHFLSLVICTMTKSILPRTYRSSRFERVIAAERTLSLKTQTCSDRITESHISHVLSDQGQEGHQCSVGQNKNCHFFPLFLPRRAIILTEQKPVCFCQHVSLDFASVKQMNTSFLTVNYPDQESASADTSRWIPDECSSVTAVLDGNE